MNYFYRNPMTKGLFYCLDKLLFWQLSRKLPTVKRLLLVNLGGIGDVVLMEPMIRRLVCLWPLAEIDILVDSRTQELLHGNKYIHRIDIFALPWLSHSQPGWLASLASFCRQVNLLKNRNYDLAFDLKGDPAVILLLTLAKIKYRIGFANGGLSAFLHEAYDFFSYHLPRANLNYLLLSNFLPEWQLEQASPIISLTDAEKLWAIKEKTKLCQSNKKTITIHLGAGRSDKVWPSSSWRQLLADLSVYNLLVIGSESDNDLLTALDSDQLINCLGYELRQTAALISQSDLFIGGDSGPGHLAAALGTPLISIFSTVNDYIVWSASGAHLFTFGSDEPVDFRQIANAALRILGAKI
jgi:ADP-heptose:LPS heptosyltransferase